MPAGRAHTVEFLTLLFDHLIAFGPPKMTLMNDDVDADDDDDELVGDGGADDDDGDDDGDF